MAHPIPMVGDTARRWGSLDALRGIAAFLVLTFHCAQVSTGFATVAHPLRPSTWLEPWAWMKFTPLRLLVSSGPPAVVLFFVLSGFVLSLPFLKSRQPGYAEFAVKRICRIYPPFAFAILVSAALYAVTRPLPIGALSAWFNDVLWDRPLSLDYVGRNLLMTGLRPDMTLDLVMWSLVHELRISLVFPLLFLLTHRFPLPSLVASLIGGVACAVALGDAEVTSVGMSLVDTGRFVFLFVAGIVIAGNIPALRRWVGGRTPRLNVALWIACVALLMFPGPSFSNAYNFVWGIGAAGLVILTVGSLRADRVLTAAPLLWLGKVSYSLYLIHVPLLIAAVHLLYGVVPLWLLIAAVIPLSLAAAEVMHRMVEEPSMRLGRALAGWRPAPRAARLATAPSAARRTPR